MFCPQCGKEIAEAQAFCQYCGARLGEPAPAVTTADAGGRGKTPWEDREAIGFLKALFRTLKETLFSPTVFFGKMRVTGGFSDPLLYALIVGMGGLMAFYVWDILLHTSVQNFMTPELRAASEGNMLRGQGMTFMAVLMPFLLIIWLFAVSGLLHLFLQLVRGAKTGFEATFRVVSYSISPFVFLLIPFCGMPMTSLWGLVLTIIGLKEAHGISGGKAAVAVLFPFIFCCGLIVTAIALFMGAIAAALSSMIYLYR